MLHQPSLSRHTNEPDPDKEYETEAKERDDYEEVSRHVRGTLCGTARWRKQKSALGFCLLKLLTSVSFE